jgi:peptidoglycan-associated lipoprotein
MSRNLRPLVLFAALPLLVIAGCKKPKPTPAAAVVEPTPAPAATPVPVATPAPDFRGTKVDDTADVLSQDLVKISGYMKDVFFDFDKADVRGDQRDLLDANAAFLKKYPTVKIRIEGHCDERGTREYNMALGDRRANAVKEFLASLGIDASRIETVSYGKEKPFSMGHDESAWAQNRRAHFVAIAK